MNAQKMYRWLSFVCFGYFLLVALAHQAGMKIPMLFIFYAVPSERYQDLIISFLAFGWSMLFLIGLFDQALKLKIHIPVLSAGLLAVLGLLRAQMEVPHDRILDAEIFGLAVLWGGLAISYIMARKMIARR